MIKIGDYSYCPANDIDCYEETLLSIGKFCSIGSGLTVISGQHPPVEYPKCVSQYPFKEQWNLDYFPSKMDGIVIVQNDVWISTNVTLLDGVYIPNGCVIGANTVVATRADIHPYSILVGNPAKVAKLRFDPDVIEKLEKIQWWDWPEEKVKEAVPYMKDIDTFIAKYG